MNPTDKELKEKIKICRGCTIYHNTDKCSDCIISKARLQGRNEFREEMINKIEELRKQNCIGSMMRLVCNEVASCGHCEQYYNVLELLKGEKK